MVYDTSEVVFREEKSHQIDERALIKKIGRYITEIYPNKAINENGYIEQEYNRFEILKLKSYNLAGLSQIELDQLISSYDMLAALYTEPFKIICMSTPVQLDEQIAYTRALIHRVTDKVREAELQKRLRILEVLENNRKEKNFYIFLYGYTDKKVAENVEKFKQCRGMLEYQELSIEEKKHLLVQMSNLGMKIV